MSGRRRTLPPSPVRASRSTGGPRSAGSSLAAKTRRGLARMQDGGRTRARTWDPLIKSQLLYQLSYTSMPVGQTRHLEAAAADCNRRGGLRPHCHGEGLSPLRKPARKALPVPALPAPGAPRAGSRPSPAVGAEREPLAVIPSLLQPSNRTRRTGPQPGPGRRRRPSPSKMEGGPFSSFRRRPESKNAVGRNRIRRSSWIPDQARDDGLGALSNVARGHKLTKFRGGPCPSFRRPEFTNAARRHRIRRCSWFPAKPGMRGSGSRHTPPGAGRLRGGSRLNAPP